MTKWKILTVFYLLFAVILFSFCTLSFYTPLWRITGQARNDGYDCVWENGVKTLESYYAAYSALAGFDHSGNILLMKDGVYGCISSEQAARAYRILRYGTLAELLAFDGTRLNALERAALVRTFSGVLYYSEGDYFLFTGTHVQRTRQAQTDTLVLLSGTVSSSVIKNSFAKELGVSSDTIITARALVGTQVERIFACDPYYESGGALYLNTQGGVRLITALPLLKTLTVEGNDFSDEGALLPCEYLEEIALPFAGSARSGIGTEYRGEFAHLFSARSGYNVPPSLKKITVTGGKLISHAFYACFSVEEINACSVRAENIDKYAFIDCTALRVLHVPKENVVLPFKNYERKVAPCGCTVFERRD